MKPLIFFVLIFISSTGTGIAGWSGPTILIEGAWGMADNQFGLEHGDTFDEHPTLDGILGDGSIVISDVVNKRTLVYKSDGTFKEKENWIEQPVEGGMIKYLHNKYLLGCCAQGYDVNGNLWTGSGDKYALTDKNGILISKVTTRPAELGKVTEKPVSSTKAKITVQYPDKTWSYTDVGRMPTYIRDKNGNLYGYGNTQVIRYTTCGKEAAMLMMPKKIVQEISRGPQIEPQVTVLEEYGSPVIAPNGDVYTWKRTPTAYSILTWTWADETNPLSNTPDRPGGFSLKTTSTGIILFWQAVPQDPGCVTGYELVRATISGGPYTALATVGAGTANATGWIKYTDTTATAGTAYYYEVRAVAGTQYSAYTAEVSGKR